MITIPMTVSGTDAAVPASVESNDIQLDGTISASYQMRQITGGVTSVNGMTGDVVLEIPDEPTKVSELENDAGYLTDYTESDPTVPAWAKTETKPSYTAAEVHALPDSTIIPTVPTNVSAFANDAGYLTSFTETDPTVPAWAKADKKPVYTASEVGAMPASTKYVSSFNGSSGAVTYTAPVTSVNGQTGAVSLTIPTVPSNVSAFTNDAGYITLNDLPIYDGSVS